MKPGTNAERPVEAPRSRCKHACLRRSQSPGWWRPWLILAALLDFDFEAIVCPRLIGEFRDALTNDYFRERFDPDDLAEIVAAVEEAAIRRDDPEKIEALLRDPDDDYLIALAREAGADAIVTGDRDLLDHAGLQPPTINARGACVLLGLTG
jgi:putative PIN family toxin of toxin-antitoxin system